MLQDNLSEGWLKEVEGGSRIHFYLRWIGEENNMGKEKVLSAKSRRKININQLKLSLINTLWFMTYDEGHQ